MHIFDVLPVTVGTWIIPSLGILNCYTELIRNIKQICKGVLHWVQAQILKIALDEGSEASLIQKMKSYLFTSIAVKNQKDYKL